MTTATSLLTSVPRARTVIKGLSCPPLVALVFSLPAPATLIPATASCVLPDTIVLTPQPLFLFPVLRDTTAPWAHLTMNCFAMKGICVPREVILHR